VSSQKLLDKAVTNISSAEEENATLHRQLAEQRRANDALRAENAGFLANNRMLHRQTSAVRRPIPVSDRMGSSFADETIRPSQSPARALATVIEALRGEESQIQDEIANLNRRLDGLPSDRSHRAREATFSNLRVLYEKLRQKGTQIYELFNVAEGLKFAGIDMTDDLAEGTLDDNDWQA